MPVEIECGCDGFHVLSAKSRGNRALVRAPNLKAVHLAVDHHYWRYSKKGEQHREGKVAGCPLCEKMREGH